MSYALPGRIVQQKKRICITRIRVLFIGLIPRVSHNKPFIFSKLTMEPPEQCVLESLHSLTTLPEAAFYDSLFSI